VAAPLPIHIVNSAARAITETAEWWAANRTKAPNAFPEELKRAFELIASHPGIGARALNIKLSDVRRVHLARVHYHLYYRVVADPPSIEVLALWHTSRGTAPPLGDDDDTKFNEPN
jgi:plasmid stabilization system protein ParE